MSPEKAPLPHLVLSGVALSRGGRMLFRGLSASVPRGGVLELRGPNGAGKTSLLLAIAGIIRPAEGAIACFAGVGQADLSPSTHLLLARNALKPRLTVGENLDFWRALNGPTGIAVEPALDRVGLGGLTGIEAGHLSTGQLRRLALARLLVTRRAIWLLDEPTAALDSGGMTLVATLIAAHCAEGGIAVVATHHELGFPGTVSRSHIVIRDGAALAGEVAA